MGSGDGKCCKVTIKRYETFISRSHGDDLNKDQLALFYTLDSLRLDRLG